MQTTLTAADFWELRYRSLDANTRILEFQRKADEVQAERDAAVKLFAERYGFDPLRPFVMDDTDFTVRQDEASA